MNATASNQNQFQQIDPNPKQFCELFGVSMATFHRMLKRGEIDTYKIGRSLRVKRESIEALRNGHAEQ